MRWGSGDVGVRRVRVFLLLEGGGGLVGGGQELFEGLGGFGVGPEVVVLVGVLEVLEGSRRPPWSRVCSGLW